MDSEILSKTKLYGMVAKIHGKQLLISYSVGSMSETLP